MIGKKSVSIFISQMKRRNERLGNLARRPVLKPTFEKYHLNTAFLSTSYLTVVTYKSIFTATKIQVITLLVPSLIPGKSISHLGCNFALVSRFTA